MTYLGHVNSIKRSGDERKVDRKGEHHIKFVEPCEDPAKSFQAAEEQLHFIALLVQLLVIFPGFPTMRCLLMKSAVFLLSYLHVWGIHLGN